MSSLAEWGTTLDDANTSTTTQVSTAVLEDILTLEQSRRWINNVHAAARIRGIGTLHGTQAGVRVLNKVAKELEEAKHWSIS